MQRKCLLHYAKTFLMNCEHIKACMKRSCYVSGSCLVHLFQTASMSVILNNFSDHLIFHSAAMVNQKIECMQFFWKSVLP